MIQVNLTSAFLLTQGLAPGMAERGFGRIVNICSIYGVVTREGRAAYGATKAALEAFTRSTALELSRGEMSWPTQ